MLPEDLGDGGCVNGREKLGSKRRADCGGKLPPLHAVRRAPRLPLAPQKRSENDGRVSGQMLAHRSRHELWLPSYTGSPSTSRTWSI